MTHIVTHTGTVFPLHEPAAAHIDISDIAIALSRIARYNGHTRTHLPYSVAEHSVLVSRLVPPHLALWGLLHDGAEAYIGDITTPLKRGLSEIAGIEDGILAAVASRFGLEWPMPAEVKAADAGALGWEMRDFMPQVPKALARWPWPAAANGNSLPEPMPADRAQSFFLRRYHEIIRERDLRTGTFA